MKAAEPRVKTSAHAMLADRRPILRTMFAPKSIALIGASEKPGSVGHALLENLTSFPIRHARAQADVINKR